MKRIALRFALLVLLMAVPVRGGYTITTLASFNDADGYRPYAGVTLSGNTLYGTTAYGGANDQGEVFSVPVSGGTPTVLTSFHEPNPAFPPSGRLTLSGSTLYGATGAGGANDSGTVFSLPLSGGTPTVLASFNKTNGVGPTGGLALSGSTLYGTTTGGGANNYGDVFSVPVSGGTPTVLASFNNANGTNPNPGLTLSGNTLYGTTQYGGANNRGEVFSVPVSGGTPTVLASFNGTNGANPFSGLTLSGNTLYGTTFYGGANDVGEVFSVPVSGGTPTVLLSFNRTNGAFPYADLMLSGNTLYGTTTGGGEYYDGEIFSIPVSGGTPTVLAPFDGYNGRLPYAGLTLSGSTFYGTTASDDSSYGTVFKLSLAPVISLTASAPTGFGSSLGTLTITGQNGGGYTPAGKSFSATQAGYALVSTWNPANDTEIYGLNIADSVAGNLNADLAALADQIDAGTYSGFSVSASLTDPTAGELANTPPGGYNLFLTFTGLSPGASSDYFGFDLSQFNANSDVLSASALAVVPEPASASLMMIAGVTLLSRRRR